MNPETDKSYLTIPGKKKQEIILLIQNILPFWWVGVITIAIPLPYFPIPSVYD